MRKKGCIKGKDNVLGERVPKQNISDAKILPADF